MIRMLGGLTLAFAIGLAAPSGALAKTSERTTTYAINGVTGMSLYKSMSARGPRHGFLSRAIAQTSYKIEWDADVHARGRACSVVSARPTLSITYAYPQPSQKLSPKVQRAWNRFMAGVRKHEQMHGRLAKDMTAAAARAVKGLRIANDPSCRRVRQEVKKRAEKIYQTYEARQEKFDRDEHRDGGNIDRLILALIKAK